MAARQDNSLPALLSNLTASLTSASEIVPEHDSTLPPKDGISLLDVKNELLLSYLQNLVFLILLKLRNAPATSRLADSGDAASESQDGASGLNGEVVKKLVELRLYLEKGVRPLEAKLKYQIDKVVRAADDAARAEAQKSAVSKGGAAASKASKEDAGDEEEEDEDDDDDDDDDEDGSRNASPQAADIDELAYRPNPAAFARRAAAADDSTKPRSKGAAAAAADDGIYRPPRITATAMPVTRGREEKGARRPAKSATLDEFIATELSAAPVAEPSVGSTIVSGGRRTKSAKEREAEAERRTYEETNFVRLPKESKKDRAQKKKKDGGGGGGYGGEEWREIGAGVDRIDRLTQKKGRAGTAGALDRSRKRPVEDGPRASGAEAGAMFAKRRKVLSKRR